MARLHTYIHIYMTTCTSLPSPVLSASMRDGVVVECLSMKQDGWIGGSSGMTIGLLPSRRSTRSEETTQKITQD